MFACQECGYRFKTSLSAIRASDRGCPKCGGTDIDLYTSPTIPSVAAPKSNLAPGYFGEEADPLAPVRPSQEQNQ